MDRDEWATSLAETILRYAGATTGDDLRTACDDDVLTAAWVVVTIAAAHVDGMTASDVAVALETWRPGKDWASLTVRTVSAFRTHGLPPVVAEDLLIACDSLLQLVLVGGEFEAVGPVGISAERLVRLREKAQAVEPDPAEILRLYPAPDIKAAEFRLAAPHLDRHRQAVAGLRQHLKREGPGVMELADEYLKGLDEWLTPIEIKDLLEAPPARLFLDQAIQASKKLIVLPHVMKGGWPDTYPASPAPVSPDWVRDFVVTGGVRTATYTTGSLHTWLLVSEGRWDRGRVERVLREVQKVGITSTEDRFSISVFLPEFSGDSDEHVVKYFYSLDSPDGLRGALIMVATGVVRFEVFAISSGSLEFVGARSLPLPEDLLDRIYSIIREALKSQDGALDQLGMRKAYLATEDAQAEARFMASQNSRFEHLWNLSLIRQQAGQEPFDAEVYEGARRSYLAAESQLAHLMIMGSPVDEDALLTDARRDFEMAVASQPQGWPGARPRLDVLATRQAFVHVDYRDGVLDWTAAGQGSDGPWFVWTHSEVDQTVADAINAFRRARHGAAQGRTAPASALAPVLDELIRVLDESVSEMAKKLEAHGVTRVIASPGADLDGVPVHLLDLGPLEPAGVSYAPSTPFLAAINGGSRGGDHVAVLSFAEQGPDAIPEVRAEAAIVASLHRGAVEVIHDATPADFLSQNKATILHVACHGVALDRLGLRGLILSPGGSSGFVSSADVLAVRNAYEADLVFLSACSSSVADHAATLIQTVGGVDYALLAAGARAAVSSQWDVGDIPALVYAVEFHAVLNETDKVRTAYAAAQLALKTDLESLCQTARDALDDYRPGWAELFKLVPMRNHPVHWGAFRLSGLV